MAVLLVAAAAGAACFAPPAAASTRSLAELQKEARQVRVQMQRLEAETQVIAQKWAAARQRLDEVNIALIQARRQQDRSGIALDQQRQLVASRMVTMYKTGQYTWLDIMANSSSFADAETVLGFLRKIASLDHHEETKYQRLAAEARRLEQAVEDERQQAVAAQSEIDAQRAAMDQKMAERAALLKDVVAQIKKILSAPELLMKAGGKVTQVTWAQAFDKSLGMPMTADNVAAIVAWEMAEGGHWYNTAYYNPLNTTQSMPGRQGLLQLGGGSQGDPDHHHERPLRRHPCRTESRQRRAGGGRRRGGFAVGYGVIHAQTLAARAEGSPVPCS